MNAILTFASAAEQRQRYDSVRRRSAEQAYDKQSAYNGRHQKALSDLEALLLGKTDDAPERAARQQSPLSEPDASKRDAAASDQTLGGGQVEQVNPPVGKTLEETIDIWRDVRKTANSVPSPTTADRQLAATATAKIRDIEGRLVLQKKAERQLADLKLQDAAAQAPGREERQFARAVSAYSMQMEAKANGYTISRTKYYVSA